MINKETFELLDHYLAIADQPEQAELIFVFGGITMPEVWQKALELYNAAFSKTIYIAGGLGRQSKADNLTTPEAETIKAFLVAKGVPDKAIITETKSTNTPENILLAKNILQSMKKIMAISKPFHMRRIRATFNKQYPQLIVLCCAPTLNYEKLNEDERKYYFDRMIGEIERLNIYAKKGDIVSQKIPESIISLASKYHS